MHTAEEGRAHEALDVAHRAEPLAAGLRFADFGVERRELTCDRRLDHEVVQIRARDFEVALELLDGRFERLDLRETHALVGFLAIERILAAVAELLAPAGRL